MKRCIFSLYIDIPDEHLDLTLGPYPGPKDEEPVERELKCREIYREWLPLLIENKKEYCEDNGIDFKFYTELDTHREGITLYNQINLFKWKKLEELCEEYDEVLYVDPDVIFMTDFNFFEVHDLSNGIHLYPGCIKESMQRYMRENYELHPRSPLSKYLTMNEVALDAGFVLPPYIYNTGIIGASKKHLDLLSMSIEAPKFLHITDNNESIVSYLIARDDIPVVHLSNAWHFRVQRRMIQEQFDEAEKHIAHFIYKQFSLWRTNGDLG